MPSSKALRNRVGRGAFGIKVVTTSPVRTFYFGMATLRDRPGAVFADKYSTGIEAFAGVLQEGAPWTGLVLSDVSFTIRNGPVVEYTTAVVDMPAALQNVYWEGSSVEIRGFVESVETAGEAWTNATLFVGKIKSVEVTETGIEMRASQEESFQAVPRDAVSANSMSYGGDPEGELVGGTSGAVAPVVYGRCGMQARDSAHDASADVWGDNRGMVLAPQLGIKVPMVPVPMVADLHSHKDGIANWQEGLMLLFSVGSTWGGEAGSTFMPWWQENSNAAGGYSRGMTGGVAGTDPELFPNEDPLGKYSSRWASGVRFLKQSFLFTWNRDYSVALPFCRDYSDDQRVAPYFSTELRSMAVSDYTQERGVGQHTANTGRDTQHHIWALQRVDPDWAHTPGVAEPGRFSGLLQSISIVGERLTQYSEDLADDDEDPPTVSTRRFGTTAGVLNPLYAVDGKSDTYATIPVGEKLSIELPSEGPQLGQPIALRVGILSVPNGSSHSLEIAARYTPLRELNFTAPQQRAEWNMTAVTAGFARHNTLLANIETFCTFFLWYNEDARFTRAIWTENQATRRPRWEWYENEPYFPGGLASGGPFTPTNFPADVILECISGTARIYSVWLECFYKPKNLEPVDEPSIPRGTRGSVPGVEGEPYGPGPRFGRNRFEWFDISWPTPSKPGTKSLNPSTTFATGIWGVDTTHRYTGVGLGFNDIIEDPVSIGLHVLEHYLNQASEAIIGAGVFGSFWDAKLELDALHAAWRMTVIQSERLLAIDLLQAVGAHGLAHYIRTPNLDTGAVEWRMFVDTTTVPASRKWRAWAEKITKQDVFEETVRIRRKGSDQIANRFTIRYGFHHPSSAFYKELHCSRDGTTLTGGDAVDYKDACRLSSDVHGDRETTLDFPWLWQTSIVEAVARHAIDMQRDVRVGLQFSAGHNMLDIEIGQFVQLDDDWVDIVGQYPGMDGLAAWGSHEWLVVSKMTRYEGQQIVVDLVLIEKWVRPPPFIP